MRLFRSVTTLMVAALAGCKSAQPPVVPVAAVLTTPQPTRFDSMTDEQLAHARQKDGLGLGLRIGGDRFPVNAPVPLHVVMEDMNARVPIASGMCSGFAIVATDTNTQDSQTDEITPGNCIAAVPYPDEIPLVRGKLKAVDLSQRSATHMTLAPGTYLIAITWHAVQAGRPVIPALPAYATLTSNAVQVTVTP